MRNSYLLTDAECQSETSGLSTGIVRKRDSAHNKARSGKGRGFAIRGTTFVKRRIQLDLRPEKPADSALCDLVLGDIIPRDGVSKVLCVGYWQRSAGC